MDDITLGEFAGGSLRIEKKSSTSTVKPYRFIYFVDRKYPKASVWHDTPTEAAHAAAEWIRENWPEAPDDTWHTLNRLVSDDLAARGWREFRARLTNSENVARDSTPLSDANGFAGVVIEGLETARTRMANMINRGTVRGVDPRAVVVHAAEHGEPGKMYLHDSAWFSLDTAAAVGDTNELERRAENAMLGCRSSVAGDWLPLALSALRAELQREADMGPEALYWQRAGEDPGRALGEEKS